VTEEASNSSGEKARPSKWKAACRAAWTAAGTIVPRIFYALVSISAVVAAVAIARGGYALSSAVDLWKLLDQHGPAAIGIPVAGLAALFLVSLARALDGPMSFDLFGLRSEGAVAVCIVWAILYLVISLSFRALW
jgi:hypothetical protein